MFYKIFKISRENRGVEFRIEFIKNLQNVYSPALILGNLMFLFALGFGLKSDDEITSGFYLGINCALRNGGAV